MGLALLNVLLCITCIDISVVHHAVNGEPAVSEPLYFALMVSSAPSLNTSGVLSAVDQALEVVHNDTTLLSGHRLQHSRILDTQVTIFNGLTGISDRVKMALL